uniref:Uncharacterized protein n=1 Tax=Rhizophora mucronata TaxID=61149 RepID=A0A2P2QBV8_RHIMU
MESSATQSIGCPTLILIPH